jgi:hypothetical protein
MSSNVRKCGYSIIRNEKVGCSIHLSGTNEINDLARPHPLGFVVSGLVQTFADSGTGFCTVQPAPESGSKPTTRAQACHSLTFRMARQNVQSIGDKSHVIHAPPCNPQ